MKKLQAFRKNITTLLKAMNHPDITLGEEHFPVKHHFSKGVYTREFFMPKDTLVVGKIHRHDHMLMLLQGEAIVADTDGVKHMKAPYVGESKAGIQRAVLAKTDCVFVTTHVTTETDLTKIENYVIAPTYEELGEHS